MTAVPIRTPSDHFLVKQGIAPQTITDATNGNRIDCLGYETLLVIVEMGNMGTSTDTVKLQESSDDGDADTYADITDATVSADEDGENEPYLIEVNLSERERYIRAVASETVADGLLGVTFVLMNGRHLPPTQDNTVVQIGYT